MIHSVDVCLVSITNYNKHCISAPERIENFISARASGDFAS